MQTDLKRKAVKNTFDGTEPILIQAFYKQEKVEAIPVDQIIFYSNEQIPALILPQESFRIRAVNKDGKVVGQYE